jgi:hypothetical protein
MTDIPDDRFSDVNSVELFGSHASADEAPPDAMGYAPSSEPETEDVCKTKPSKDDLAVFDRLVEQSMLSAQLCTGLELPWEQGVFRSIFSDAPLWSPPEMPQLTRAIQEREMEAEVVEMEVQGPLRKRQRTSQVVHGLYDRAIAFGVTLTDPEIERAKWARALEKLCTVFSCCPAGCPAGLVLDPSDMASNFQKIRQLCGSRSCGTVLKRANDLFKFCWWHKKFYYQKDPATLLNMCGNAIKTVQPSVLYAPSQSVSILQCTSLACPL